MSEAMAHWYVTLGEVARDEEAPGQVRSACLHALAAVDGYRGQVAAVTDLAADIPDLLQTYVWSHPEGTWGGYAEFVADRIRAALTTDARPKDGEL